MHQVKYTVHTKYVSLMVAFQQQEKVQLGTFISDNVGVNECENVYMHIPSQLYLTSSGVPGEALDPPQPQDDELLYFASLRALSI